MKLDNIIATRKHKKIYRDNDLCIKVFDSEFSKADVLNEALNLARIEEIGINTPKLHEVTSVDGKWAIVCDFIEGKTLEQLIQENPDKFDEYLAQVDKFGLQESVEFRQNAYERYLKR